MLVTMSAFPKSGRSDRLKFNKSTVRFRPEAEITLFRGLV
jgi:hypothetical protein